METKHPGKPWGGSPSSVMEDAVQALIRTTQHEFPVVDRAA
ncbi:hypothetical protein N826_33505 [Skermanella aerolata KACC 11604]|nr:hypothetical protein N826_33505 [Skermanella aerolata KACC 11604]